VVTRNHRVIDDSDVRFKGNERGIEGPRIETLQQQLGVTFQPSNHQTWILAMQCRCDVRQQIRRDGRQDPDPQRARQRIAGALRGVEQVIRFHQDSPCTLDQLAADGGEEHSAPVTLEEAYAEHVL